MLTESIPPIEPANARRPVAAVREERIGRREARLCRGRQRRLQHLESEPQPFGELAIGDEKLV